MNKRLIVRNQLDDKMLALREAESVIPPSTGWIYAMRYAINMSLRQLGKRMSITPQSVKEMQEREKNGTVSIQVLRQVASALDMKFVYGFVPMEQTLTGMIEKRAGELAEIIVHRASTHMKLEDQGLDETHSKRALEEKVREIKDKVPKILWD
jgi:predicted DNA-binding mobile mystery protein A